ncbi:MAG: fused MFS/spermidine synthase [Bryobacterales bacterium]|nr:fused MFS/spermidine synthase [Bryobacterales bacterium]
MVPFALTIFLSAFLLFQIQPIAAKMILPWFGGGASVWSACMVFFQMALLLGYLYAHWLHEKLTAHRQAIVHSSLLLLSLVALPIGANPSWKGVSMAQPALGVVGVLALMVGLPYLLLSTTGPLLQAWYGRTHAGAMPYRLYALSNVASMLALVSYPFLVEPHWTVRWQGWIWSAGYVVFASVCAWTAWRSARGEAVAVARQSDAEARPGWSISLLWIALASCASILLLAITRHVTQDVAPVPFLWLLPLSLYLLSFIICFEAPRLYYRPLFLTALPLALGGVGWILDDGSGSLEMLVTALSAALFVVCMVCHGEMVRRKPGARHLTKFYLMMSVGGALGGLFVGLLAPMIFNAYLEFPIGLALCAALWLVVLWGDLRRWLRLAALALVVAYGVWLWQIGAYYVEDYHKVVRNFYSQLRVEEYQDKQVGPMRSLLHGRIYHGEQGMSEAWRRRPTAYYCPDSGVGRALLATQGQGARRIGVVGLGCGTLAAYGQKGDTMRIYEINPQMVDLARTEFTYLKDSAASIEMVMGDGRLMLERDGRQEFDVLALDAFSGDSIPTHLVTLEAIGSYLRQVRPGGILAVHITNSHLDLDPVIAAAAAHYGLTALLYRYKPPKDDLVCRRSNWALLMTREAAAHLPPALAGGEAMLPKPGFRPWTDDYSNLFQILK